MPGDGQRVLTKLIKFVVVDVIMLLIFNNTALCVPVPVPQDRAAKDSNRQGCVPIFGWYRVSSFEGM